MGRPNDREIHILQFFKYEHLPARLRDISKPFCLLAEAVIEGDWDIFPGRNGEGLPDNPEREVVLRKLLEAKDAAVRTALGER